MTRPLNTDVMAKAEDLARDIAAKIPEAASAPRAARWAPKRETTLNAASVAQATAGLDALPKPIQDLGWKAQVRLCKRFRRLVARGKHPNEAVTAIAKAGGSGLMHKKTASRRSGVGVHVCKSGSN